MVECLCAFGFSREFYAQKLLWLEADPKRRLIFVDTCAPPSNHPRVKHYLLESPLQVTSFATQIAKSAVFGHLELINVSDSPYFSEFKQALELAHRVANLCLNDAVDCGETLLHHAKKNLAKPYRSALDLAFPNVPAIIVGAGPSLEKNGHLLESFRDRALIFAGGSALERLHCAPHFAACIDPVKAMRTKFPAVPFCFQARAHPDTVAAMQGERFLVPDGHFSFLNWLSGERELFDVGWTVGNFMAALASHWGCDPIIFVGMDYCYAGTRKYAFGEEELQAELVQAKDRFGNTVWTQNDWLMAISWMEDLAKKMPRRTFWNATSGGMDFLPQMRLEDISLPKIPPLTMHTAKLRQAMRWKTWEASALRAQSLQNLEGEIVHQEFLEPMWRIWKPVFEREVATAEELCIHERLFYNQMLQRIV